jgi:Carbon-nitrogen hydrolase
MPGDTYPKFRAAAVQAAPVFLDRDATIDKLETLVQKAVDAGAELIVFGESFIPAFPVWNLIYAPMDQHGFFRQMFENAVQVPGPHTRRLSEIAKRHRVILSWPRSILLVVSSIRWSTISSATTIGLTFFIWKLTPPNRPVWIKQPMRRDEQPSDESLQVAQEENANSANERSVPVVMRRAKA